MKESIVSDVEKLVEVFEKNPEGISISGLTGGSLPYWLCRLRSVRRNPWLILAESSQQAENLLSDLLFFAPELKNEIYYFPAWEPHPFDTFSPHPDTVISRLEILYRALEAKLCVITTVDALMQRVIPQEVLIERSLILRKDSEIDRETLVTTLCDNGYQKVTTVEDRGTFAIRGGIFDVFPPLSSSPFRLEFIGDKVETIRTFDPENQLSSVKNVFEVTIIPVREIIFTSETVGHALEKIKKNADEHGVKKSDRDQILEYLKNKIYFSGIDYYLPFFYPRLETFFDYFPQNFEIFYCEKSKINELARDFEEECHLDSKDAIEKKRISVSESDFYLSWEEVEAFLKPWKFWNLASLDLLDEELPSFKIETLGNEDIRLNFQRLKKTSLEMLKPLAEKIKSWRDEGNAVFFVAHTKMQQKRFRELMEPYGLKFFMLDQPPDLSLIQKLCREMSSQFYDVILMDGILSRGFGFPSEKIIFITEEEVFGERKKRPAIAPSKKAPFVTDLSELRGGDPIVHKDHGIGRYLGLKRLPIGGSENDYLLIEYADKDKLYLPVHRLNVVHRYGGVDKEKIRLEKLGGTAWAKTKKKVKKAIQDIAHELLEIYAARQSRPGISFSPPDSYFHEFEATFPFEETEDQQRAIEEVISDLCSHRSMDRIVCGDVGYGKTEVGIRAAFKVVMDKKQVAVLAPTTLLVDQHYRVFKKRLESFPIQVEALSRFVSSSDQKGIIQNIKKGGVDIVIGTHRLLSHDIEFYDLGLLIIDEEQRFGVVHKEKIKKMKKTLDVLTLSATPIPRTLHMSLLGIRDLSVMNTPPQDRLAIRTYVTRFDDQTIREAILNEIHRGGQVFFVHNRVETIAGIARHLQRIVPEARIGFAHGQMRESQLETIILDFLNQKFNVLVCTTIIGSGIDMPSVNTIVIDRADTFGLASLYQLRGRVGRSYERAYAYLLIPTEDRLTDDARKRLQAIQGASELGAGFKIASYDLEIRGGGNILGKDQSGHVEAVGFEMYTELLEQTIRELKGEAGEEEGPDPEINLRVNAYIPQDYMPEMSDKLTFYRHLAMIQGEEELEAIEAEMRDRFGPLPEVVYALFEVMAIKFYVKKMKVKSIDFGNQRVVMTFSDQTPVDPSIIVDLVKKDPKTYRLIAPHKFLIHLNDWQSILPLVRKFAQEWLVTQIPKEKRV